MLFKQISVWRKQDCFCTTNFLSWMGKAGGKKPPKSNMASRQSQLSGLQDGSNQIRNYTILITGITEIMALQIA